MTTIAEANLARWPVIWNRLILKCQFPNAEAIAWCILADMELWSEPARGFRMDQSSGSHPPGVPHVHFELYPPGGRNPYVNNHVPIIPPMN